ncbi:MAG: MogA/MoaB family molybdenum cofactor biosynthesis protein [Candidatus Nanopelagicales bacterium]
MTVDWQVVSAVVITVSDRAFAGEYEDRSGPIVAAELAALGFEVGAVVVVADGAAVGAALREEVARGRALVLTTGGTGLAPRDLTPEQTRLVIDREVPGIAERIRAAGAEKVPTAMLSRGIAGVADRTLIINLAGSTGAVRDGMDALGPVLMHAVEQIGGSDHG